MPGAKGMREYRKTAQRLQRLAWRAARSWKLPLRTVRTNEAMDDYGGCLDDGSVEMRLTTLRNQRILCKNTLVDTLAHELAHTVFFSHGREHRALTRALKLWLHRNWST